MHSKLNVSQENVSILNLGFRSQKKKIEWGWISQLLSECENTILNYLFWGSEFLVTKKRTNKYLDQ